MNLLLDTGILGKLCHPNRQENQPAVLWLESLLEESEGRIQVFVPELSDYELRRKLLHLILKK